jgi:hypothetical protein
VIDEEDALEEEAVEVFDEGFTSDFEEDFLDEEAPLPEAEAEEGAPAPRGPRRDEPRRGGGRGGRGRRGGRPARGPRG